MKPIIKEFATIKAMIDQNYNAHDIIGQFLNFADKYYKPKTENDMTSKDYGLAVFNEATKEGNDYKKLCGIILSHASEIVRNNLAEDKKEVVENEKTNEIKKVKTQKPKKIKESFKSKFTLNPTRDEVFKPAYLKFGKRDYLIPLMPNLENFEDKKFLNFKIIFGRMLEELTLRFCDENESTLNLGSVKFFNEDVRELHNKIINNKYLSPSMNEVILSSLNKQAEEYGIKEHTYSLSRDRYGHIQLKFSLNSFNELENKTLNVDDFVCKLLDENSLMYKNVTKYLNNEKINEIDQQIEKLLKQQKEVFSNEIKAKI